MTAQTTVRALWTQVIQPFGCLAQFHSDRGPNFESALMKQLCDTYGIAKSRITPYHPAGNGSAVRFNQTLLTLLPVDIEQGVGPQQSRHELGGWVKHHQQSLSLAYSIARQRIDETAAQHKQQYDKKAKAMSLLPGEQVWVWERNRQGRGKLCTWWSAKPYVILDKMGDTGVVYRVQSKREMAVSKPYIGMY